MSYTEGPRTRKPRTQHLTSYPPAHASQSWDEGKGQRSRKDTNQKQINRNTVNSKSFDTPWLTWSSENQKYTAMRKQMQRRFLGPDPTVPHLKYGIFPKRPIRAIPLNMEVPMHKPTRSVQMESYRREIKKPPKKAMIKTKESKPVIYDNLSIMRQLTISASTHVDIKPQRFLFHMDKTTLNKKNYYS